jgi:hypothetical protein
MTRFDPSILLRRLVVTRDDKRVYDERFHEGVNIIRGAPDVNSVGKSTIAHFIFYSLGGEGVVWVEEALRCSYVYAEVELNGVVVTLQREVSEEKLRPMSLFWGELDTALSVASTEWKRHTFSQHSDAQTFTHVLFQALGIPDVKDNLASRLTMHQLLRLMFADQTSPPSELYRNERFSGKDVHDAIGALLCGVYDSRIYEIGISAREMEQERSEIAGRLKAIWSMLGTTDQVIGSQMLESQLKESQAELEALLGKLKAGPTVDVTTEPSSGDYDVKRKKLSDAVRQVSQQLSHLDSERTQTAFEIEDSAQLIEAISVNSRSLDDSLLARRSLGAIDFAFCPACFAPLERLDGHACIVCKAPPDKKQQGAQISRMRQELSMQLQESELLQQQRRKRLVEIDAQLPTLRSQYSLLKKEYDQLVAAVMSPAEFASAEAYRAAGYLTRKIEDLNEKVELAKSISNLEARKATLEAGISKLNDERTRLEAGRVERQQRAYAAIKKQVADIVSSDLPFEEAFKAVEAEDISFSFSDNSIKVSGRRNFSASSLVILKNSFHAGLLFASAEHDFFRYPRFALFDNTEDKGMTPARSHNFQEVLVAKSKTAAARHQIILTTSMISPKLNTSEFTIGPEYTSTYKSLDIGRPTAATQIAEALEKPG